LYKDTCYNGYVGKVNDKIWNFNVLNGRCNACKFYFDSEFNVFL
jgi:hypothetical protein